MKNQSTYSSLPATGDAELKLSVNQLLDFTQKGKLPKPVQDYYAANDRLPGHLYIPLAKIIDNDMAAQERAMAMGKPAEARSSDDYRVELYANDPIMRELIDPFRLERQQISLNRADVDGLSRGELPSQVLDHVKDYNGELPATMIEPVKNALIETTLERQGLMYPAFEQLYVNSFELPGLVDQPIREGLKEQGLLPADSTEWRADIAHSRESSEAVALGIAERIQTDLLSIALPGGAEHLRQYLENDNYLSDEEINRAIFDSQTSRETMSELVVRTDTSGDAQVQSQVTDYLMDLNQNVKESPALQALGPLGEVDLLSAMELGHQQELHKAHQVAAGTIPMPVSETQQALNRQLINSFVEELSSKKDGPKPLEEQPAPTPRPSVLSQIGAAIMRGFQKETPQSDPVQVPVAQAPVSEQTRIPAPGLRKETGTGAPAEQPLQERVRVEGKKEEPDAPAKKQPYKRGDDESVLQKIASLKFKGGGLVSLVHNYTKVKEIFDRLFGNNKQVSQTDNNNNNTVKIGNQTFTHQQLIKLLEDLLKQQALQQQQTSHQQKTAGTPEVVQGPQRQMHPLVNTQGMGAIVNQNKPRPSLLSRMTDHYLDKLAVKLAPRLNRINDKGVNGVSDQPSRQQTTAANATRPVNSELSGPATQNKAAVSQQPQPISPSETARQQQVYIDQPKKYTWEQLTPHLEKIGVQQRHLDPMNRALLLDGRATKTEVPVMITDKNGLSALAKGQLMILELPGKGPSLAIVPPNLRTSFNVPTQLNLYPEDILRLQKTGMANRPIEMVNPTSGKTTEYLVGYDRNLKTLTLIEKDKIQVPSQVLGKDLTPQQQQELSQGRPIRVDGLRPENGRVFNATMQFSASQQGYHIQPVNAKKEAINLKTESVAGQNLTPLNQQPLEATTANVVKNPLEEMGEAKQKNWDNKQVLVAEGGNSNGTYQKRMGDLNYTDTLIINNATGAGTPAARIPLNDKGDRGGLLSPSDQARIAYGQIKTGTLDSGVKNPASPAQIQAAQATYQVKDVPRRADLRQVTNTSVVEKNGARRITQDQTGYAKTQPGGPQQAGKPGQQAPAEAAKPSGQKPEQQKLNVNGQASPGRAKNVPDGTKVVNAPTPPRQNRPRH